MVRWTRWWGRIATTCAVPGAVLAVAFLIPALVVLTAALGAMVGAVCGAGLGVAAEQPWRLVYARASRTAAAGGGITMAVMGYLGVVPLAGLPVLLGLAASSPRALRTLRRALPSRAQAGEPVRLDDETLCLAWRTSWGEMNSMADPRAHLAVVERRAALLDELARRHPEPFRRWTADGPRPTADLTTYFVTVPRSEDPEDPEDPENRDDRM